MTTDDDQPYRFSLPMKAEFGREHTREETLGCPIRYSLGDDVIVEGIIVDWTDEPDGSVTLTVEAQPM